MLEDLYKKIEAIEGFDIAFETLDIIKENEWYITMLVTNQLRKGRSGGNESTRAKYGSFYTEQTVFSKESFGVALGKQTDFVTMFDTGDFYESLYVAITSGETFEVKSNIEYFPKLNFWNEGRLIELDSTSLVIFSEEVLFPELKRRFSARFNGI